MDCLKGSRTRVYLPLGLLEVLHFHCLTRQSSACRLQPEVAHDFANVVDEDQPSRAAQRQLLPGDGADLLHKSSLSSGRTIIFY